MNLTELKARLDGLSPAKVRFVANVVESLSHAPRTVVRQEGTWITGSPEWLEYFGLALSVHHGSTTEPLGLTSFETVFRNACRAVGWEVDPVGSATRRFVDATIWTGEGRERKLSLKSTAAGNLSRSSVHISKLTEAAWIQDKRTAVDRLNATLRLFRDYRAAVDSIVMLRAFRRKRGDIPYCYQLVEIPGTIFDPLQRLGRDDFKADAPALDCSVDGRTVAVVAIDRSDAKITVKKIRLDACTVHAEWIREDFP